MKRWLGLALAALLVGCGVINLPGPQPSPAPTATPGPRPTPNPCDDPDLSEENAGMGGTPCPSPTPPPGGGIRQLSVHPTWPHCLQLDGKPYTILAYGNLVTAIPERHRTDAAKNWRGDLQLIIDRKGDYARLWDKLWGDTDAVDLPWAWSNGKYDLSQKNPAYWSMLDEVVGAAAAQGIVVEVMVFDRGQGGSQSDYRNSPWFPANNVNGLGGELPPGGLGVPEFYEVALKPGSKTAKLAELYVRWYAEWAARWPNVVLEIENENRAQDANNGRDWCARWAGLIKAVSPRTLTSFSTLNLETLDKVYAVKALDIVNPHFGDEGNNSQALHSYIYSHWSKGKPINVDEFANGLGNKALLADMCDTIRKHGGMFHIEDAAPSADAPSIAQQQRAVASGTDPPACSVGPVGPAPVCPKETKRGWSILFVNRGGKRFCTGNTACEAQMRAGKLKPGDNFALDSTALEGVQRPIPEGCGTCVEKPTKWTTTTGGKLKQDGPCGAELFPAASGIVCAASSVGSPVAVCKGVTVK